MQSIPGRSDQNLKSAGGFTLGAAQQQPDSRMLPFTGEDFRKWRFVTPELVDDFQAFLAVNAADDGGEVLADESGNDSSERNFVDVSSIDDQLAFEIARPFRIDLTVLDS
jgi:hypothetical protein